MSQRSLSEPSPMRRLNDALAGGLGRGRLGVVASCRGVGKTPLLVQLAVDALLGDRKVLHVSLEHDVDHVRAYYDEILLDLAARLGIDDVEGWRLALERRRLILSTLGLAKAALPPEHPAPTAVSKLVESVDFARDAAGFAADVVIVDGLDFSQAGAETAAALGDVARRADAALWASVTVDTWLVPDGPSALPAPLGAFADALSAILFLEPDGELVRLRLLDVRAQAAAYELGLRFEPHSMRVVEEARRAASDRPRDPSRYRLVSGGSRGAEAEFGACAEQWGLRETNYSFHGHDKLERQRGVVVLGEAELGRGDFSLLYVSKRLGRELSGIPAVRQVLQSICHQITEADQVFVVGTIQDDGTVKGGTGWGAELARAWNKPLHVFDQRSATWFHWSGTAWEASDPPVIASESFAGIGTQKLTDAGQKAIRELFVRSFGPA